MYEEISRISRVSFKLDMKIVAWFRWFQTKLLDNWKIMNFYIVIQLIQVHFQVQKFTYCKVTRSWMRHQPIN